MRVRVRVRLVHTQSCVAACGPRGSPACMVVHHALPVWQGGAPALPHWQRTPCTYTRARDTPIQTPNAGDRAAWSTLFIRPDTVAEAVAAHYGVAKSELLDARASGDLPVRMALGEAAVVAQTKAALAEEGACVRACSCMCVLVVVWVLGHCWCRLVREQACQEEIEVGGRRPALQPGIPSSTHFTPIPRACATHAHNLSASSMRM